MLVYDDHQPSRRLVVWVYGKSSINYHDDECQRKLNDINARKNSQAFLDEIS